MVRNRGTQGLNSGKRQNIWLTRNWHKTRWNDRDIPCAQLGNIFQSINLNHANYYAKGLEKRSILQNLPNGAHILDLTQLGCPKLETLKIEDLKKDYIPKWYAGRSLKNSDQLSSLIAVHVQRVLIEAAVDRAVESTRAGTWSTVSKSSVFGVKSGIISRKR